MCPLRLQCPQFLIKALPRQLLLNEIGQGARNDPRKSLSEVNAKMLTPSVCTGIHVHGSDGYWGLVNG